MTPEEVMEEEDWSQEEYDSYVDGLYEFYGCDFTRLEEIDR